MASSTRSRLNPDPWSYSDTLCNAALDFELGNSWFAALPDRLAYGAIERVVLWRPVVDPVGKGVIGQSHSTPGLIRAFPQAGFPALTFSDRAKRIWENNPEAILSANNQSVSSSESAVSVLIYEHRLMNTSGQAELPNLKQLRVLMVEDSPDDAELLKRHLTISASQVSIDRVANCGDMRDALAARDYDVVIADYSVPGFRRDTRAGVAEAKRPRHSFHHSVRNHQ